MTVAGLTSNDATDCCMDAPSPLRSPTLVAATPFATTAVDPAIASPSAASGKGRRSPPLRPARRTTTSRPGTLPFTGWRFRAYCSQMAGNDHIPTAPTDVIGDDGDLRRMRDALRAGKNVTLAPDGAVYISPDATNPMTDDAETFIESKLGMVVEMARMGYGVSVHPDGSISADRADHRAKVLIDPDPALSEQQLLLIDQGIGEGALIRVHSDGRLEYFLPLDSRQSGEQAAQMRVAVKQEIDSGRLQEEMRNGHTLSVEPDGTIGYETSGPTPTPIEFPEDVQWGHEPLLTADQLAAEAHALEIGASAARGLARDEYETDLGMAAMQRDAVAREHAAADARALDADRQVAEKQGVARELKNQRQQAERDATVARNTGDTAMAEERAEDWARLNIEARVADQQAVGAQSAAADARVQAANAKARLEQRDADIATVHARSERQERAFDEQEDQARVYRQAADEMREAERLDEAYTDLEARGVADADRVKEAAAAHRARAEELRTTAEEFDAVDPIDPIGSVPSPMVEPAQPTLAPPGWAPGTPGGFFGADEFSDAVPAAMSDEVTFVAEQTTQDLALIEDSAVIDDSAVIEDSAVIDDFSVIADVAMIEMPDAAFLADEATIAYTDRADQQTDDPYEAEVPDTFEV